MFVTALFDINDGRLPGRGCLEFFHPVKGDFNRFPALVCKKNGNMLIGIGVQLAAKSATDNRFNDSYPFVFKAHGFKSF